MSDDSGNGYVIPNGDGYKAAYGEAFTAEARERSNPEFYKPKTFITPPPKDEPPVREL